MREIQGLLEFPIAHEHFAVRTPPNFLKSVRLVDANEPDWINPDISYAEACANQLRYHLEINESGLSSRDFFLGTEMPELAHHGNHHARHFELALKKVIKSYLEQDETMFQGAFGQNILNAMLLTPYFHDWDQLNTELRMIQDPELVLSAKMGHAVAGAVQVLCLTEEYARLNGISPAQAQKITSMAAVMILRHDEPGNIVKAFNPTNKSAVGIENPDELRNAFDSDELDLTTLSPAQIITLLKAKKGSMFIDGEASRFGLSPNFEKDYAEKLFQLEQETDPLLTLDPEEKRKLTSGTEMVVWADLVDMVSPYWDAILRTFQSAPSKKRPFSWKAVEDANESRITKIWDSIEDPQNGNNTKNDIERLLWEFYHLDKFTKQTCLAGVPFVNQFNKEHTIMGAIALREVAEVMLGSSDLENLVHAVYGTRASCLQVKSRTQANSGTLDADLYWQKIREIDAEKNRMTELLKNKKNGHDLEDLYFFQSMYGIFMTKLNVKYGVTDEEIEVFTNHVSLGSPASTQLELFSTDSLPPVGKEFRVTCKEKLATKS